MWKSHGRTWSSDTPSGDSQCQNHEKSAHCGRNSVERTTIRRQVKATGSMFGNMV